MLKASGPEKNTWKDIICSAEVFTIICVINEIKNAVKDLKKNKFA